MDIHSFPNKYEDEAGDINLFQKNEVPPDIAILSASCDTINDKCLSKTIHQNLLLNCQHGWRQLDVIRSLA